MKQTKKPEAKMQMKEHVCACGSGMQKENCCGAGGCCGGH